MSFRRFSQLITALLSATLLCAGLTVPAEAATKSKTKSSTKRTSVTQAKSGTKRVASKRSSSRNTSAKKSSKRGKTVAKRRGQQAIESERARQIQEALIRDGYLDGEPSGAWDDDTRAALKRYQADNGWQSKVVPDSRALIKLGLGPDHSQVLNPESVLTLPASAREAVPGGAIRR